MYFVHVTRVYPDLSGQLCNTANGKKKKSYLTEKTSSFPSAIDGGSSDDQLDLRDLPVASSTLPSICLVFHLNTLKSQDLGWDGIDNHYFHYFFITFHYL